MHCTRSLATRLRRQRKVTVDLDNIGTYFAVAASAALAALRHKGLPRRGRCTAAARASWWRRLRPAGFWWLCAKEVLLGVGCTARRLRRQHARVPTPTSAGDASVDHEWLRGERGNGSRSAFVSVKGNEGVAI